MKLSYDFVRLACIWAVKGTGVKPESTGLCKTYVQFYQSQRNECFMHVKSFILFIYNVWQISNTNIKHTIERSYAIYNLI